MNQTVNFRELLKLNSHQVERPKSLPKCWLLGTLGNMSHEVTKGKGTNVFIFDLHDLELHPGTDEEIKNSLEDFDFSKLRSPYKKNLVANFWITPDSMIHLTNMLDSCVGDEDRSIEERLPEVKGLRVMFQINPVLDNEGKDTGQNEVDSRTMRLAESRDEEAIAAE